MKHLKRFNNYIRENVTTGSVFKLEVELGFFFGKDYNDSDKTLGYFYDDEGGEIPSKKFIINLLQICSRSYSDVEISINTNNKNISFTYDTNDEYGYATWTDLRYEKVDGEIPTQTVPKEFTDKVKLNENNLFVFGQDLKTTDLIKIKQIKQDGKEI